MVIEGYKQTEVGSIPNDWNVIEASRVGYVIRGASPRPKGDKRYYGGSIPRLMVEDVTRDGKYVTPKVDFLTHEGMLRSRPCSKGTLTIVCSGTVGVPSFLAVEACIHDGFLALTKIKTGYSEDYIYHYFKSQLDRFDQSGTHGGVFTNLTTQILNNFQIPFPTTEKEQKAIAEALSDVDALIESLEKLIAKKRAIKTTAMQELIIGDRKLEGFSNERQLVSIGKDTILKARIGWQALTTAEYLNDGDYLLVTGTEFSNGKILWNKCHAVSKWRYEQDRNIQVKSHDVLVTKDGTIGKIGYVHEVSKPATLNSGVFVVRPTSDKILSRYLYYTLRSKMFDAFLNKITAGSTITHLYQKDFVAFEFEVPEDPEEQKAISMILTDMDEEIYELEGRLETTKNLKQGMMQELLTGKTRLA